MGYLRPGWLAMPRCVRVKRKHRKICIGDVNDLICLQDRAITAPLSGVDATEEFEDIDAEIWALVETSKGETVFDETNTEIDVTHRIYISFLECITAETWIKFKNKRYDILNVENLEERDEWLLLRCTNRGTGDNKANEA